jgi:quinol monooxygenase YgiN
MIFVTIRAKTHPDKRTEFTQTVTSLLNQIRKSPGCLSCYFYQEFEEENTFCLFEEWASQEEFENYLRTNSFCVLLGAMQILLKHPSEIKIDTISHTSGQEGIDAIIGKSN